MKSQLTSINFMSREYKDSSIYNGFMESDEVMEFIMPNHDLDLIIKETSIIKILTVERDYYQNIFKGELKRQIVNIYCKEKEYNLDSPATIKATNGEIIDIYVRFSDIYMHLDNINLYSQGSIQKIEKAGVYDSLFNPPDNPSDLLSFFPTVVDNNREIYHHFRLKMTENITLSLKWIERLYQIMVNMQSAFTTSVSIFDTQKRILGIDNTTGAREITYYSDFPYETYASYVDSWDNYLLSYNIPHVKENKIKIVTDLKDKYILDKEESCYKTGYDEKIALKDQDAASPRYVDVKNGNIDENRFSLLFNMYAFKEDINFFLKIKYKNPCWILKVFEYESGTITLDKGMYTIYLGGAKGGDGGGANYTAGGGDVHKDGGLAGWGNSIEAVIEITEITIMTYKIGQAGKQGHEGIGQTGGPGGGTSYIKFNKPVKCQNPNQEVQLIYCNGSRGADGAEKGHGSFNLTFRVPIINVNISIPLVYVVPCAGGEGGGEGSSNNTGSGESGKSGKSDWLFGSSTTPGEGGIGYRYDLANAGVDPGHILEASTNSYLGGQSSLKKPTRNGYLLVKYQETAS